MDDPVPLDGNPLDPGDAGRLLAVYYFDNATEHANWLSDPLTYTPDESVEYTYDAFGRTRTIVQDPDLGTADDERITETTYDAEGRTVSIVTPEGHVTYGYDAVTGDRTHTTGHFSPIRHVGPTGEETPYGVTTNGGPVRRTGPTTPFAS